MVTRSVPRTSGTDPRPRVGARRAREVDATRPAVDVREPLRPAASAATGCPLARPRVVAITEQRYLGLFQQGAEDASAIDGLLREEVAR